MAIFQTAYQITGRIEGGWCNVVGDSGGETYRGIARNYHPGWMGWVIVDREKAKGMDGLDSRLAADKPLEELITSFYKNLYWDVYCLDNCDSQLLANEIYDSGVNIGTKTVAQWVQRALNALNNDLATSGGLWEEITVDGKVNLKVMEILNKSLKVHARMESRLYKILDGFQRVHYVQICESKKIREKFLSGWLDLRTK